MAQESNTRSKRARKRLVVRFSAEGGEETRTAFTANLSEHGILLKTRYIHPPGTLLSLEVQGPETTFAIAGRVVWVKRVPARLSQVTSSSMGIYFKDPGPEWAEFSQLWKAMG